jgi:hypothetical protein
MADTPTTTPPPGDALSARGPAAPSGSGPDATTASSAASASRLSPPRRTRAQQHPAVRGLPRRTARPTRALGVAIGIHVVLAALLVQFLTLGHGLYDFLGLSRDDRPVEERLTYVETPPEPATTTGRVAGRQSSPVERLAAPQVGAPVTGAPAGLPAVATDTGTGTGAGTGRGRGTGVGAVAPELRGVQPDFNDPRVWGSPGNSARVARSGTDNLDSVMGFAITAARDSVDSLARAQGLGGRRPGDWTTRGADGSKWGWDEAGIRLGKVTIPNALLGLLPLNAQAAMSGNPIASDRERRIALSRADIQRNSQQAIGEADFKKAVKELRERKERERAEQRARAEEEQKRLALPPRGGTP